MDGYVLLNLADSCQQMVTLCREMKVLVYTLLNPTMAAAWRNAGEFWRAISSRIISIRIQLHGYNSKNIKKQGGKVYLTVISVYAPNFRSPQEHRDEFIDANNVECSGVRDIQGVGNVNKVHDLTVMNTWYEKKDIYKYTWQRPGRKMWHCIDYVLMRQSQRTFVGMP